MLAAALWQHLTGKRLVADGLTEEWQFADAWFRATPDLAPCQSVTCW
jgi:hypothetical protein